MIDVPDPDLHWTEHYVTYGFAVRRGLVDPDFCARCLAAVPEYVGQPDHPMQEWTRDMMAAATVLRGATRHPVFDQIYDQPGIREMIDTMFGDPTDWNGAREYKLFVNPWDPAAKREVTPDGHIDFVRSPVPALGSGFMFQVALREHEMYNGNLTLYPGTHIDVQRAVIHDPAWRYPDGIDDIPRVEPFEFVAQPGDVAIFHHLVLHNGNHNAATTHLPRVALHCQALRREWLQGVDPVTATSPWARSLAQNGAYTPPHDELAVIMAHKRGA